MEKEDKDLISDIKQGKKEVIEELIKKHQKRVYNIAYGLVMDYDKAWDISQEVFVKLVKNINQFREESSFTTYLYRVVMNTFYDFKRRDKHHDKSILLSETAGENEENKFEIKDLINIEEDAERKFLKDDIKKAMVELTNIQKQVFVLKNMEGLAIKEIANFFNISDGTVKSHLSRAMEKIKIKIRGRNNG